MSTPVGYLELSHRFALKTLPLSVESRIDRGAQKISVTGGVERRSYPAAYHPGDASEDHLEFALKHEPLNLGLLAAWFEDHRDAAEKAVVALVQRKPTGEYARRAWFFYEWLTQRELALPNGRPRSFVPALDASMHVAWERQQTGGSISAKAGRSPRHHVTNNLPGVPWLCPLVRRTAEVNRWLAEDFGARLTKTLHAFPASLYRRATDYLYLKETRASFEIEGESLSEQRTDRFVAQLHQVAAVEDLRNETFVEWQRELVEPRFAASGYRDDQVYVGQAGRIGRPGRIHYIAPKPEDVPTFMDELLRLDSLGHGVPALVHAATVSFAFVFIHPFDDGNGRLHRLLIHNILARRRVTPRDVVFPVSAVMLDDRRGYDDVLESFSKALMQLLEYERDEEERVTVKGPSARHYRYFDATPIVEALGRWIDRTLTEDFPEELQWLDAYDRARSLMKRVVDLPEKHARGLIQVLLHNAGRMSKSKRSRFPMLSDDEVNRLSAIVREELLPHAKRR